MTAVLLLSGPLLAILPPGPAAGEPYPGEASWSDNFDAPGELSGLGLYANVTVENGFLTPVRTIDTGTGSDGELLVTGAFLTDSVRTALSASAGSGQSYLQVNTSSGFRAGDEVLIIQMTGSGAGRWEYANVASTGISRIDLTSPLQNSYFTTSGGRAQVLRVPQYTNVTVASGGTLTCSAWDGATGGVLCIRIAGNLVVESGGLIDVSGRGFPGGEGGTGGSGGLGGMGGFGGGRASAGNDGGTTPGGGEGGSGASGWVYAGGKGGNGGGAGEPGSSGGVGKPGGASGGSGASAGQGGTNRGTQDLLFAQMGQGGGGGTGGSGGFGGGGGGGGGGGYSGGSMGSMGGAGGRGGAGGTGGAGGGIVFITASKVIIKGNLKASGLPGHDGLPGGAGGAGGNGGSGGAGGGVVYYQPGGGGGGGNGAAGGSGGDGGGGGAGGTVWLRAYELELGENLVRAIGGAGGRGAPGGDGGAGGAGGSSGGTGAQPGSAGTAGASGSNGRDGGAGGGGLIRLDSVISSGSVQPPAYTSDLPRTPLAWATSIPIRPASLARWATLNVTYRVQGEAGLRFDVLDASSGEVVGEWQPSGEGEDTFDLSGLTAPSIQLRVTFFTNGSETAKLDSWSLSWVPNHAPHPPRGLAVEGRMSGSPEAMRLTTTQPSFNWTFTDEDSGQNQSAFNISVCTGPGGTGLVMWSLEKESATSRVVFGEGGEEAIPLQKGNDYFVSVRVRDSPLAGPLWSQPSEMGFHINAPPTVPALIQPENGAKAVPRLVELKWSEAKDPEGDTVLYNWQISTVPDFSVLTAEGLSDETVTRLELPPNATYHWRVRASDDLDGSEWSEAWSFTTTSNRPPSLSPFPPLSLAFNETRELDLSPYALDPEDGRNLSWSARLSAGPEFNRQPPPLLVTLRNSTLFVTATDVNGSFTITLTATDSGGLSAKADLTVVVFSRPAPLNKKPVLTIQGSSLRSGERLRIDLSRHVSDESPSTLRWAVSSESPLLTVRLEGTVLILDAGKVERETRAVVVVRVWDEFNLTDEARPVFTILPPGTAARGEEPRWILPALGIVVLLLLVLMIVALVWRGRKMGVRYPAYTYERQETGAEEAPEFRSGIPPGGGEFVGPEPAQQQPYWPETVEGAPSPESPERPGEWIEEIQMDEVHPPPSLQPPRSGGERPRSLEEILEMLGK